LLSGRILLRFGGFRQGESSGSPLIAKNARKRAILTVVMKVIKQRFARRTNRLRKRPAPAQIGLRDRTPDPVWQKRFYDFNVWTERKRIEKLRYMHCNPVNRGLVEQPDQWKWSRPVAHFSQHHKYSGCPISRVVLREVGPFQCSRLFLFIDKYGV